MFGHSYWGCHIMFYEIEMVEEYFRSVRYALEEIENPEGLVKKGILGRKRVLEKYTYESNASDFSEIYSRIV